jgi:TolB-like protein
VAGSPSDRLDSWKEIAAYLNRSVRTVRRWEADEGLPVHRHMHRSLGTVYAYRSEIDRWRQSGGRSRAPRTSVPSPGDIAAAEPTRSIAVLPFTNLSPDPDNAYFAAGLTDELIADLSRIRPLRVISRRSSMALKGTTKGVKAIARELGVRYIVEGPVRRAGSRLRITAQLIDAASDTHVWADKFEGSVEDVFAIQERVARVMVDALRLRLSGEEERRLAERPIANLHAYECYLQARQAGLRWRRDSIDHAVQLLKNGLAIVGDNAELYAALERTYLHPGNPMGRLFYVWVLAASGRKDTVGAIAGSVPYDVCETIPARLTMFLAHAVAGRRHDAIAILTPEIEAAAHATDLFPRFLAQGYALAGEPDLALRWLAVAVERGFINYPFLAHHDPFLDLLRSRPDFWRLMDVVREQWQAFQP